MAATQKTPQSWGRYPVVKPSRVIPVFWRSEIPDLASFDRPVLAYGYGRSYGDSCLNEDGIVLDTKHLNRFIAFDEDQGLLCCEAGVSLAEILDVIVPRGWFLPVSPGTKFVSLGGAIANDVHGKNHHRAGTFGSHVTRFELLRSTGERLICSLDENSDLFCATIGGLGLTGLILWAEFRLKPITNSYIAVERIRFSSVEEFMSIADDSERDFEYTVSWVDTLASGNELGRGVFIRGNHDTTRPANPGKKHRRIPLAVPFDLPSFVLNTWSIKAFNVTYYTTQFSKRVSRIEHYDPFFYPLDFIHHWNRLYGKRGLFQYQCAVPYTQGVDVIKDILQRVSSSGEASFLTVFKKFGDIASPGILSFPRPGLTLNLDFPNNGKRTRDLFYDLDRIVQQCGGALYPAKDALMSPENFRTSFPRWQEFEQYIDPKFSSSFWRRMTNQASQDVASLPTITIQPHNEDEEQ